MAGSEVQCSARRRHAELLTVQCNWCKQPAPLADPIVHPLTVSPNYPLPLPLTDALSRHRINKNSNRGESTNLLLLLRLTTPPAHPFPRPPNLCASLCSAQRVLQNPTVRGEKHLSNVKIVGDNFNGQDRGMFQISPVTAASFARSWSSC